MTVSLSLNRVLVALLVSFIAVLCSIGVTQFLGAPAWVALWVFGFVLLALSASVTVR